jgi:hypothetical protein
MIFMKNELLGFSCRLFRAAEDAEDLELLL